MNKMIILSLRATEGSAAILFCERSVAVSYNKLSLRGAQKILSLVIASPVGAKQSLRKRLRLPRYARNDNLLYQIAQPVPSKAKESSSFLAMTFFYIKLLCPSRVRNGIVSSNFGT
jgi:hypothetical protein